MDNMAKSAAKNDQAVSNGQVAAEIIKNKYQNNQTSPQGHEAL